MILTCVQIILEHCLHQIQFKWQTRIKQIDMDKIESE